MSGLVELTVDEKLLELLTGAAVPDFGGISLVRCGAAGRDDE